MADPAQMVWDLADGQRHGRCQGTIVRYRRLRAPDRGGNLVIADTRNHRVRAVAARAGTFYGQAMTAGDIYTVAGSARYGFSGDGGPATRAALYFPEGVAADGSSLLTADSANSRVWMVGG